MAPAASLLLLYLFATKIHCKVVQLSSHFKDAESVARATTDALISDHFLPLFFFLIRSSNEHDDNIRGDFLLGDEGHSFDNHDSGVILLRGRVEEAVGILLVGDGPACSSQSSWKVVYYVVIPASLIVKPSPHSFSNPTRFSLKLRVQVVPDAFRGRASLDLYEDLIGDGGHDA